MVKKISYLIIVALFFTTCKKNTVEEDVIDNNVSQLTTISIDNELTPTLLFPYSNIVVNTTDEIDTDTLSFTIGDKQVIGVKLSSNQFIVNVPAEVNGNVVLSTYKAENSLSINVGEKKSVDNPQEYINQYIQGINQTFETTNKFNDSFVKYGLYTESEIQNITTKLKDSLNKLTTAFNNLTNEEQKQVAEYLFANEEELQDLTNSILEKTETVLELSYNRAGCKYTTTTATMSCLLWELTKDIGRIGLYTATGYASFKLGLSGALFSSGFSIAAGGVGLGYSVIKAVAAVKGASYTSLKMAAVSYIAVYKAVGLDKKRSFIEFSSSEPTEVDFKFQVRNIQSSKDEQNSVYPNISNFLKAYNVMLDNSLVKFFGIGKPLPAEVKGTMRCEDFSKLQLVQKDNFSNVSLALQGDKHNIKVVATNKSSEDQEFSFDLVYNQTDGETITATATGKVLAIEDSTPIYQMQVLDGQL